MPIEEGDLPVGVTVSHTTMPKLYHFSNSKTFCATWSHLQLHNISCIRRCDRVTLSTFNLFYPRQKLLSKVNILVVLLSNNLFGFL